MILFTPAWDRTCAVCMKYVPRDDGTFMRDKRTGLPVLRTKGDVTPCGKCPKVPESVKVRAAGDYRLMRAGAVELTEQNRQAYRHYRRCKAVGQFPPDPLVWWVAGVVREIEDEYDRVPAERIGSALAALVAILPYLIKR